MDETFDLWPFHCGHIFMHGRINKAIGIFITLRLKKNIRFWSMAGVGDNIVP